MMNNIFIKVLSSVSLDMITLIIDITVLISNFMKLLSSLSMNMITWTSPWSSTSSWRSCLPCCWWPSPSSPPARDARQHHYLLLVIIPELLFVCENLIFPEYRICFCFQFLVVGRLCALLDSLLYLTFNLQWKLYWLSWQSFKLIHGAQGKFLHL